MEKRVLKFVAITVVFPFAGVFSQMQERPEPPAEDRSSMATLGDVNTLLDTYEGWKAVAS